MNAFTVAALVFGQWVAVTPTTVSMSVPEWVYAVSNHGSAERITGQPLPPSCAVYEAGHLVGYSLNCEQRRRAAADLPES